MARAYRLQGEGILYHITSRGDDRKKIFLSEQDYIKFLDYLTAAKEKYEFRLYAWCLMGNHYHLLFETTHPNLSQIMQKLNTAYTVYYNIKRKRSGHVFQGRFKSIIVDKDSYLLELTRYIHLNPVRAKMVALPEDYRWSSYREYLSKKPGLIDKADVSRYFTMSPAQYAAFVHQGIEEKQDPLKSVYAGFILGKVSFIKQTLGDLKGLVESGEYAHKKRIGGVEADAILEAVTKHYKIDREQLRKRTRQRSNAKNVAVYLLMRCSHLTNKDIGALFGITHSAVSKIAGQVAAEKEKNKALKADIDTLISYFKV